MACYDLWMDPTESRTVTIPNIVSALRIIASPVMIPAAIFGWEQAFLIIYVCGMLSDLLDGVLARALHARSRLGALLDTIGDGLLYCCAAIGAFLIWPERMMEQAPFFVTAACLFTSSVLLCFLKHRRPPSYHTWITKTASACIGITATFLFLDMAAWPFRMAVALLAVSAAEAIAITLLLKEWQSDIPTLIHALRIRKEQIASNADHTAAT